VLFEKINNASYGKKKKRLRNELKSLNLHEKENKGYQSAPTD